MNAAVLHTLGKPPACKPFPDPSPQSDAGEVMVEVRAASLKPVDKQLAAGSHYASPRQLPVVCGTDGVGQFSDGTRVFFGGTRPPYGSMAQRTVVNRAFCFPVPDSVDDETAAALPNPGVSAWLALAYRAKLQPGENVMVLGATGVTGRLAVKCARLLGARRVVAAGRNQQILNALAADGADATIRLDVSQQELTQAFERELGNSAGGGDAGFQVVIDYVWGKPVEALLTAMTRREFAVAGKETRLVQAGESAGAEIAFPAAVLRSTALTVMGTAGIPPRDVLVDALKQVMAHAASGELRVETERVPLAEIESAWQREPSGQRLVVIP